FVLDKQDGFVSSADAGRTLREFGRCGVKRERGHEDFESGACANTSSDLDPTIMLLDDAINRSEAETGAFAHFFGSEERLEDARQVFGGNASAGIGHGEANK